MEDVTKQEVTQLLIEMREGSQMALDKLTPLIYNELRQLASGYLKQEYQNRTILTTDLVHEAYLRLIDQSEASFENRAHFFGAAARLMRQILINYAKKRNAQKRGGGQIKVSLDEGAMLADQKAEELVALDEALIRLAEFDERLSRIVELRYFSGLTIEETAQVTDISPATVKREWRTAKAWLYSEMKSEE